jgi:hypothetical protein
MLFTLELDETIRRCEIAGIRIGIETVCRLYPQTHAESIEVGGGLVAFTGADSPLTQAYGVGAREPVTPEDIERITDFYESRGAVPRVFVTPLSDATLAQALASNGYAPCEYENILASDAFEGYAMRDGRIAVASDLRAWALASAQAFTGREVLTPADEAIALTLASSDGVWPLEGRENGEIVATAVMDLREECAALFAGSTMPRFRSRGWHIAMIRDRIARARDGGAQFMRATARPSSISERNFVRCGFRVLYTRTLWERPQRRD